MSELKKKILLDVFVTPGTVLPVTGGLTLILLSLMFGAGLGFFGFCLVVLGVGLAGTNLLFGLEKITKQAVEQLERTRQEDRNRRLDELDGRLTQDDDPRDQTALRNLRTLYDSFTADFRSGKVSVTAGASIHQHIEDLYQQCVAQLEQQHDLWLTSRKVTGQAKADLLKLRSDLIAEVEKSVSAMGEVMSEVRALGAKAQKSDLGAVQQRLRIQLDAAKEADELVRAGRGDLSRYAEYQ